MAKAASKTTTKTAPRKNKAREAVKSEAATGVDLGALDRDHLLQLERDVNRALRTYEKRRRDEALREMQLVADKHGISMKDVVQGSQGRNLQPPKYRHPENPSLTWSGRGRQPAWFKEAIDAGTSRDDLLIA